MPVTVAMYDKGLEHIGARLDALGLDIKVSTFSQDGRFRIDGTSVAPSEFEVDYLWLNSSINADGFQEGAFELALACNPVGVLQTFNAGLDHPFYKRSRQRARASATAAPRPSRSRSTCSRRCWPGAPDRPAARAAGRKQWKITPYREISADHLADRRLRADRPGDRPRVKAFGAKDHGRAPHAANLRDRRQGRHPGRPQVVAARGRCDRAGLPVEQPRPAAWPERSSFPA